ncbi:MAG TPA: 4-(cytidine 5'-diphospho)-2-C-methyl-D-erythritol kinase [Dehalococcoidales bacterium]|nr:4-(cytidine 5'-diphospho)-2-C-methyl-D-erythritol kinase [Dehalococcoidales bacterium]
MTEFVIKAPAKINLTLEVLGKRPDGFHEIRSVIQTVSLFDILRFSESNALEISGTSSDFAADKSLISKAVSLVKEISGYCGGVKIIVEKHIPLFSGLGGDSSDAAAVLQGLNRLWDLRWETPRLSEIAARLGSDVGFFLTGGTAVMAGRGEQITPLKLLPRHDVVIVNPALPRQPGKTALAYASLQTANYTDGSFTRQFINQLYSGQLTPSSLFNTFESVFFNRGSELAAFRDRLLKLGAPNVHLAGSGPALFSILADKIQAEALYARTSNTDMDVYLAETC